MYKIITTTISILLFTFSLIAQQPAGGGGGNPKWGGGGQGGAKMPSIGRLYGKIIDSKTKQPVAFASVTVFKKFGPKDSLVGGGLSEDNGEFNITALPVSGLKLKISFVGYKDFEKIVKLSPDNTEEDAGNLAMDAEAEVLKGVEITAEKSQVLMSLEKRVFNVDKNLSATGGTAEDVLKNVPSVTVDADGNVKLRNNSPTVFVDGKPTMLTITQIPADQIESVEVITNPSAKYDASTTGGILNLVLKKNRKAGYNGMIGLTVGYPSRYGANLNLNVNQGKWNVGLFYNLNAQQAPVNGNYLYRTTPGNKDSTYFNQITDVHFENVFQNARVTADYSVNNRNTLSVGANFVVGKFNITSDQVYNYLNSNRDTTGYGERQTTPRNTFNNAGIELGWKKTFVKKGETLNFSSTLNHNWSSNDATWYTTSFLKTGKTEDHFPETDIITGSSVGNQVLAQLDYTNPINDSTKIEMGVRSFTNIRDNTSIFNQHFSDAVGYTQKDYLSQVTSSTETVNAAYVNYSGKLKHNFNYQAGLRFEQSSLAGTNKLSKETFGYSYPKDSASFWNTLYPSFAIGQKVDEKTEWGFTFSRKVQRPNGFQLMAGVQSQDRQNIRIGNPNLQPEFVNKMELGYNKMFAEHTWLSTLYYEIETNSIKSLATPSDTNPSVLITQWVNGNHDNRYGWDNTLKLAATKNFDVTASLNVFNVNISVDTFNKSSWSYVGKLGLTYKFPGDFTAQLNTNYESQIADVQGYRKAVAYADFSLKKSFFHKAANVIFSVNDIFDSRKQILVYELPKYTQEQLRRREIRNVRLAIQIPFGKQDANMFKKKNNRQQGGGQDQQGQDY